MSKRTVAVGMQVALGLFLAGSYALTLFAAVDKVGWWGGLGLCVGIPVGGFALYATAAWSLRKEDGP